MRKAFLDPLPRGGALAEQDWRHRHRLVLSLLVGHIPVVAVIGAVAGRGILPVGMALLTPAGCALLGHLARTHRRAAALAVTVGLVSCSAALVALTGGAVAAHLHFFVVIGVVALYRDWVPLLVLFVLATASHLLGSSWAADPGAWALLYGLAVLAAGVGGGLLLPHSGQVPEPDDPAPRPDDHPTITPGLLVDLARRNQGALHRQLEIIDRMQVADRASDAQAELGTLARLASRVRRNADRMLVLAGEPTARTGGQPTPLGDVVNAATADIEDADRIVFEADQLYAITGHAVTDLVHLIAELAENAVRFSPSDSAVAVRARAHGREAGGLLLTVEDWGVGLSPAEVTAANALLTSPTAIDRAAPLRLGFPVVARLAARHGIGVSLGATPSSGITATIVLPPALLAVTQPDTESVAEAEPRTEAVPAMAGAVATCSSATDPSVTGPSATGSPVAGSSAAESAAGSVTDVVPVTLSLPAARPADGAPWRGWWAADRRPETTESAPGESDALPIVPSPRPRSAPPDAPLDPVTGLRKRVPQAHLAPELRQPTTPDGSRIPAPGLSAEAAQALSRYQASRTAARTLTGNEHGWLS